MLMYTKVSARLYRVVKISKKKSIIKCLIPMRSCRSRKCDITAAHWKNEKWENLYVLEKSLRRCCIFTFSNFKPVMLTCHLTTSLRYVSERKIVWLSVQWISFCLMVVFLLKFHWYVLL